MCKCHYKIGGMDYCDQHSGETGFNVGYRNEGIEGMVGGYSSIQGQLSGGDN